VRRRFSCSGALYPALWCHAFRRSSFRYSGGCGAQSSSLCLRIREVTSSGAKWSCRLPGKAQACLLLALLSSRAPLWRCDNVGWSEGETPLSRESDGLLCRSMTLKRPCRYEGRQSAASEAILLAALPRSFAAASGLQLKTKALLYSRALFFPC